MALSATPGSFMWHCLDKNGIATEIVVLFDNGQIIATAISAYWDIVK